MIDDLLEDFEYLDDWETKYDYLINTLAKKVPPMDDADKTDANIVEGCMSQVWLKSGAGADGAVHFTADSDSAIVKGLIYILLAIFDGQKKDEIKKIDPAKIFDKIGINAHLTLKRRNGLSSMIDRIKKSAL